MNGVAALAFLASRRRWEERFGDTRFWVWLALVALASVPLVNLASTAVDRMSLYLLPFQIIVAARIPALIKDSTVRAAVALLVVLAYAAVLAVWLNYSWHARQCWVPYGNYLFM